MQRSKSTTKCGSKGIKEKVMSLDSFAETFKVKFDDGKTALPTILGSILSILLFILTVAYAAQKTNIMIQKEGVDVITATKENYFADDYKFSAGQGFQIAVGFTNFIDLEREILDPTYGEIKIYRYSFGLGDDQFPFVNIEQIKTHSCTREELGLEKGEQTKFMPITESFAPILYSQYDHMLCIDDEDSFISGNQRSAQGSDIVIHLAKCNNSTSTIICKSEEDIETFFRGSSLLLLNNQIHFDQSFYGEESIK